MQVKIYCLWLGAKLSQKRRRHSSARKFHVCDGHGCCGYACGNDDFLGCGTNDSMPLACLGLNQERFKGVFL